MRRAAHLVVLAALAGGCNPIEAPSGAHALRFPDEDACAEVELPDASFPAALTVEAWVRADEAPPAGVHPLVVWNGAFALWEDADGVGTFGEDTPGGLGASAPTDWMDGELHHVAATWDGSTSSLYLDGERLAFHEGTAIGVEPAPRIQIGCWGAKEAHRGIIDEVRLSSTVRYADDFDRPEAPFEPDDATLHLWHLDEGEGAVSLDEAHAADVALDGVEWADFDLSEAIAP